MFEKFITTIEGSDDLKIIERAENGLGIEFAPSGTVYTILREATEEYDHGLLLSILRGQREARELRHVTRICGYYSQIENWNRSKVGELRGRHAGDYAIGAVPSMEKKDDCNDGSCSI